MREEVTRGHCHDSLARLRVACQQFIAGINAAPETVVDRLWPKFELDPEYEAKLLVSTRFRFSSSLYIGFRFLVERTGATPLGAVMMAPP
jgi:hypothetical protein